jgi:hypothetical protein
MPADPSRTQPPDVNADLQRLALVRTAELDWQSSPSGTVWRKPLYRSGGEYGPVTSIVRYASGGAFAAHAHPEGEEILVLEGVFSDEHGDYPAGSFLLNPHGSRHTPRSGPGCVLFVRLRQYPGEGRERRMVATDTLPWMLTQTEGVVERVLYAQPGWPERVALRRWPAGVELDEGDGQASVELFLLSGSLAGELGALGPGCWLRIPAGTRVTLSTTSDCLCYRRSAPSP